MKPMKLVRYRPEYREAIIELHHSAIGGLVTGIDQHDEEADLRDIEKVYFNDGGEFLVGLLEGRVIAMGGFQRVSDTSAELRRMRIQPDLQGQGYGTQLLRELERLALQSGIYTLSFETARARPLTLEFYHKHGYQETGHGFYGKVETVHFSKTLNNSL